MMYVETVGCHRNKDHVELYLYLMARKLKINRLSRPVTVHFKGTLDNDAQGLCVGDKKEVDISIATKDQPFMMQMQALAHEMVHAKQFLRGELSSTGVWKWKGRNANNFQYKNQPWEKEAYRLERELFLDCWPWALELNELNLYKKIAEVE